MSAAKDEADDGPLESNNEGNSGGETTLRDDENGQENEERPFTAKLSKPNGFEEEGDFGPLQASSPVPERPSSADESLSIPDDTPSLQGSIESSIPAFSNINSPAEATYLETQAVTQKPKATEGSRDGYNEDHSQPLSQHIESHSMYSKNGMKAVNQQPTEEPTPNSSASEISPSQIFIVKNTDQTNFGPYGLDQRLDSEQIRPRVDSNLSTMAHLVVLLSAFTNIEGGQNELSLPVSEISNRSPTKITKTAKRKKNADDQNVDELDTDDYAIGIPKKHYQPRPSKRRARGEIEKIFVPTDFSRRPKSIAKGKRKTKRHKTTAFQELLPINEDEDEEVKMLPDPRFEIPEKKHPKVPKDKDQLGMKKNEKMNENRLKAQPKPKQTAIADGQKKRDRPKKTATNLSEELVLNEIKADHDEEDAETKNHIVSATASISRKTKITGPPEPVIYEQERSNCNGAIIAEENSEDILAKILTENNGNIIASDFGANQIPQVSSTKANCPPETPRKIATPAAKGPDKHSPISSGKMAYRVGLSKRARIAPLLRIVRK